MLKGDVVNALNSLDLRVSITEHPVKGISELTNNQRAASNKNINVNSRFIRSDVYGCISINSGQARRV